MLAVDVYKIGDVLPYAVGRRGVSPPGINSLFFLLSFLF